MADSPHAKPLADIPGALGSAIMVLVGAAAIWAARDYSDLGAVFPRTVGALLVALGVVYIVLVVLGRTRRATSADGSFARLDPEKTHFFPVAHWYPPEMF